MFNDPAWIFFTVVMAALVLMCLLTVVVEAVFDWLWPRWARLREFVERMWNR